MLALAGERRAEELEPAAVAPVDARARSRPSPSGCRRAAGRWCRGARARGRCRSRSGAAAPPRASGRRILRRTRAGSRRRRTRASAAGPYPAAPGGCRPGRGCRTPRARARTPGCHSRKMSGVFGATTTGQRGDRAAVAQAPREEARVVLVLVRPAERDDPAREIGEPALEMAVDRLVMAGERVGRQSDTRVEQTLSRCAAPRLKLVGRHRRWEARGRARVVLFFASCMRFVGIRC